MTVQAPVADAQAPPELQLMQLASGCLVAPAIYVVTKLGIADLLKDGPRSVADLADATGADADSLYRVMRATASVGVFVEGEGRIFANSPVSDTLRVDWPRSTRAMTLWMLDPKHWNVYSELMYSVETGKTAWDKVYGEPCFESLFGSMRGLGDIFNQAMTSFSLQTIPAILEAYDFSPFGTIADIAGGYGHLLGGVLRHYLDKNGILFEVPVVLEGAPAMLDSYGVTDRVQLVAGDFVEAIPVVADCYMLKHIIHDWYDDKNQTILGNIRKEMPPDARVLIIDGVVPPANQPHFVKFLDLEMLMLPGGKERTEEEFAELLAKSGFRMTRVIPTKSPSSIIEAVKA
ncbi:MAG TPA: methyltransferase [Pyrinomonadaceae bacterium]|nr:methyltransferase [Pyrinomonadaceae bacterium]